MRKRLCQNNIAFQGIWAKSINDWMLWNNLVQSWWKPEYYQRQWKQIFYSHFLFFINYLDRSFHYINSMHVKNKSSLYIKYHTIIVMCKFWFIRFTQLPCYHSQWTGVMIVTVHVSHYTFSVSYYYSIIFTHRNHSVWYHAESSTKSHIQGTIDPEHQRNSTPS